MDFNCDDLTCKLRFLFVNRNWAFGFLHKDFGRFWSSLSIYGVNSGFIGTGADYETLTFAHRGQVGDSWENVGSRGSIKDDLGRFNVFEVPNADWICLASHSLGWGFWGWFGPGSEDCVVVEKTERDESRRLGTDLFRNFSQFRNRRWILEVHHSDFSGSI